MSEDQGALIFTFTGDGRRFLEAIPARDLYEADTVLLSPQQLGSLIPSGLYAEAATTRSGRRTTREPPLAADTAAERDEKE